jgi:hypothetical protein
MKWWDPSAADACAVTNGGIKTEADLPVVADRHGRLRQSKNCRLPVAWHPPILASALRFGSTRSLQVVIALTLISDPDIRFP